MKPLIDADVLRYEVGFCGQGKNEGGELEVRPFDNVSEILDQRILDICHKADADQPPRLYLTGPNNFREAIATSRPYKGQRKDNKPYHYTNLTHYILAHYDCVVTDGIEADDQMVIDQMKADPESTIICTRDKDLRMCPGWHYGWECGRQPEFGPMLVDELGWIEGVYKDTTIKDVKGVGLKFFYNQLIVGDKVDNIPGLPKGGPALSLSVLQDLVSEEEMFNTVSKLYEERMGEGWEDYLLEQGRLLWMVREVDDEGNPVMWEFPDATAIV